MYVSQDLVLAAAAVENVLELAAAAVEYIFRASSSGCRKRF
jgi:hypothetical protein